MNNKISVIIPAYNAEKTIQRTLSSLVANKDFIYEVQLIDDHSTDKTVEKAKSFMIFSHSFLSGRVMACTILG